MPRIRTVHLSPFPSLAAKQPIPGIAWSSAAYMRCNYAPKVVPSGGFGRPAEQNPSRYVCQNRLTKANKIVRFHRFPGRPYLASIRNAAGPAPLRSGLPYLLNAHGPGFMASKKLELSEIDKAPTGIPGLDDITHGGLPAGRPTLVAGGPGSGKILLEV